MEKVDLALPFNRGWPILKKPLRPDPAFVCLTNPVSQYDINRNVLCSNANAAWSSTAPEDALAHQPAGTARPKCTPLPIARLTPNAETAEDLTALTVVAVWLAQLGLVQLPKNKW